MRNLKYMKLNRLVSMLLIGLLILVLGLSAYVTKRTQDSLDSMMIERVTDAGKLVVGHINSYFDVVTLYDRVVETQWDPRADFMGQALQQEEFARRLVAHYPQIASLQYGDTAGNFVMYRKDAKGNINTKIVYPDTSAPKNTARPRVIWRYFEGDRLVSEVTVDGIDYDPRERPWYLGAKDIDGLFMTEPYAFFTGNTLGITGARRLMTGDVLSGVYSFDIELGSIVNYINTLDLTADGETFLVTPKNIVIGLLDQPLGQDPITGIVNDLPKTVIDLIADKSYDQVIRTDQAGAETLMIFEPILTNYAQSWTVGIRMDRSALFKTYQLNVGLTQLLSALLVVLTSLLLFYRFRQSKVHDYLEELARYDQLTGLMNRHTFEEVANELLRQYAIKGEPFSILIGDIDEFKRLNDTFGHGVGDEVLVAISKVMTQSLRSTDYACRWGGEEFLIVLPQTDQALAEKVAQSLVLRIEKNQLITRVGVINVTMSFGVATYHGDETMVQLINRADGRLYKAKESGKNKVCCD